MSRLDQSPVTLSSSFGPLFSTCRAGGLGGGCWGWVEPGDFLLLQCHRTVLKSHTAARAKLGKTALLSEQPEGACWSLTSVFWAGGESVWGCDAVEEGFEWNPTPSPSRGGNITTWSTLPALWGRESGFPWPLASWVTSSVLPNDHLLNYLWSSEHKNAFVWFKCKACKTVLKRSCLS